MVLAIVQARLSSTRLPGKVLKPILGRPMLWHQLERIQNSRIIDQLMVATSDQTDDQRLVAMCREFGVSCFCGSLNDVLDRFYKAAQSVKADTIVRLTGDCPIIDAQVIDSVVQRFQTTECDYASNTNPPTFPDGLDVEVMRFDCLEIAWREARLPSQREHVTPFIHQQPQRFNLANYTHETDLSHLRWTVDEPEDFEFVTSVFKALYPDNPKFTMADVLELLKDHPGLSEMNAGFERNEGMKKSILQDESRGNL